MTKTLDQIIDDIPATDLTADDTGLKALKAKVTAATTNHENAAKDDKAVTKTALEDAEKAYNDKRSKVFQLIKTKIDEAAQNNTLAIYSQEVADRRKQRKATSIEDDINKAQGQIDIYSIEIAEIDQEIEEKRKSFAPDKS